MTNLYQAWEVRTPYPDTESFNEAIARIKRRAADLGVNPRWRKGRGRRYQQTRYHYWEVTDEAEALMLMMACGDKVNTKIYSEE